MAAVEVAEDIADAIAAFQRLQCGLCEGTVGF
jgi:hypothetical protein